ncbi:hypothetical protein A2U01_0010488, partial [Trifolium medium]|nr:hypothetical protein [Trifolium medium]
SEDMDTDANTGNSNSINDNVHVLQAQKQPQPETNNDIDPTLLQPLNVIHPPTMSDLPNINPDTEIETVIEGFELATEIHKNKSQELTSLLHQLKETNPQTQSHQSSPLQILEQHLQGELPRTPEQAINYELNQPSSETIIEPEQITKPNTEPEILASETEKIQEVEISQLSESQSPEQQIPQILTETEIINDTEFRISPIPEHITQPEITNSEPLTSELSLPEPSIPEAPPVSNPELAKICNKILDRMKNLHQLRYSFTDLELYLESWDKLRKDIDEELARV